MNGMLIRYGVLVLVAIGGYFFVRHIKKKHAKAIIIVGTMFFCFLTVLYIDWHLYWTAAFAGVFAAATLFVFLVVHFREHEENHEREQESIAIIKKSETKAETRRNKINKIKSAVTEAEMGVISAMTKCADVTKTGVQKGFVRLSFWRSKNRT